MSSALTTDVKINPEALEFVQNYLSCLNIDEAAEMTGISHQDAVEFLKNKEVKRFVDTVFLEQGYLNRFKLVGILDKIVESKLQEAEETGVYSGKDLIDILTLIHKIGMDHAKIAQDPNNTPSKQTNVQVNNYGDNLGSLIDRIVKGE